jgi:hypothetical protein
MATTVKARKCVAHANLVGDDGARCLAAVPGPGTGSAGDGITEFDGLIFDSLRFGLADVG